MNTILLLYISNCVIVLLVLLVGIFIGKLIFKFKIKDRIKKLEYQKNGLDNIHDFNTLRIIGLVIHELKKLL